MLISDTPRNKSTKITKSADTQQSSDERSPRTAMVDQPNEGRCERYQGRNNEARTVNLHLNSCCPLSPAILSGNEIIKVRPIY
jgi:hypothetical protein